MDFSLVVSFSDSHNFGREEIFNIRMVATANNRKMTYGRQNKLNAFRKIDCPSSEDDQKRKVNAGQTNMNEKQYSRVYDISGPAPRKARGACPSLIEMLGPLIQQAYSFEDSGFLCLSLNFAPP